jgi:hypothetical protein
MKVKVLSKENEKLKNHICVYSTQNEILDQEKKILEK